MPHRSGFVLTLLLAVLFTATAHAAKRKPLDRDWQPPAPPQREITQWDKDFTLLEAARLNDHGLALFALSAGANVNVKDDQGFDPLDYAAYYGHGDMWLLLIEHGADPFAPTNMNWQGTQTFPNPPYLTGAHAKRLETRRIQQAAQFHHGLGNPTAWPLHPTTEDYPYKADGYLGDIIPEDGYACSPLNNDQTDALLGWCAQTAQGMAKACQAAKCSGQFTWVEQRWKCLSCDKGRLASRLLMPDAITDWKVDKATGNPMGPDMTLSHYQAICHQPGETFAPKWCDGASDHYQTVLLMLAGACKTLPACEQMRLQLKAAAENPITPRTLPQEEINELMKQRR